MLVTDMAVVLGRIDAVWPPKKAPSDAERAEWARYLQPLDRKVCERAIDDLKLQLGWRPSMADFRAAYSQASYTPSDERPQLPAPSDPDGVRGIDYDSLYGHHRDEWVYCWRCDMAITLEERCGSPCHHAGKGLHHASCPKRGTAPSIPVHLRIKREEAFAKPGWRP